MPAPAWCIGTRGFEVEPDRFDPGRSDPDAAKSIDRYSYLPFGAGPRTCIGQNFAQWEATAGSSPRFFARSISSFERLPPEPRLRVTPGLRRECRCGCSRFDRSSVRAGGVIAIGRAPCLKLGLDDGLRLIPSDIQRIMSSIWRF
ncbi:MAG: cytochrome P450 [Xanthobacteraceae bacterium]